MRSSRITTLLVSGAVGLSTLALAPAEDAPCYLALGADTPDDASDDVEACQITTWIADAAGTKAGNLAAAGATDFPTFSDVEPTGSVASAGGFQSGAGYLGTSLLQLAEENPELTGFTIEGEITGVIDALAITLHGRHNGYGSLGSPTDRKHFTAYVSLEVDGVAVIPVQSLQVEFTTDPAPTANASERFRANITGLAKKLRRVENAYDPSATHQVRLRITPRYVNTDPATLFLYGTKEVPSGVVFNPAQLDPDVSTV